MPIFVMSCPRDRILCLLRCVQNHLKLSHDVNDKCLMEVNVIGGRAPGPAPGCKGSLFMTTAGQRRELRGLAGS